MSASLDDTNSSPSSPGFELPEWVVKDRVRALDRTIISLKTQIRNRKTLSRRQQDRVRTEQGQIEGALSSLILFPLGANTGADRERALLQRRLSELHTESRQERATSWKDLAGLRRELRLARKEHADLIRTARLLASSGDQP